MWTYLQRISLAVKFIRTTITTRVVSVCGNRTDQGLVCITYHCLMFIQPQQVKCLSCSDVSMHLLRTDRIKYITASSVVETQLFAENKCLTYVRRNSWLTSQVEVTSKCTATKALSQCFHIECNFLKSPPQAISETWMVAFVEAKKTRSRASAEVLNFKWRCMDPW